MTDDDLLETVRADFAEVKLGVPVGDVMARGKSSIAAGGRCPLPEPGRSDGRRGRPDVRARGTRRGAGRSLPRAWPPGR